MGRYESVKHYGAEGAEGAKGAEERHRGGAEAVQRLHWGRFGSQRSLPSLTTELLIAWSVEM